MRVLAVLIVGIIMYVGVPYLWQRAMVAKVNEISAGGEREPRERYARDGNQPGRDEPL